MGGQPSGNSTVRNVTEVDPVTQEWRRNIMGAGGALYNQGTPAYYPGNTVVPFSNQTQGGLDYLQNYATQGATNLEAMNDSQTRALSGFNPAMMPAMGAAMGGLSGNPAAGALQGYGDANNPYLRGLFDQGASQVSDAVNANFARSGRYASGAHSGTLGREIGNLYNNIYAPAYEAERNRGLTADQTLGSLWDSGANRTLEGINLAGGMWSQGNQDAARAAALQPSLWSYGMQPGQALLDVGGMYEGLAGDYLNADRERYDYNANAPWDYLQRYAGMMSGLPDFSGSTQSTRGPGTNRMMSGLGGAMSGFSMGNMLFPGMGGMIGGGLGLLGGLFG